MDHRIYVTVEGADADELSADLALVAGAEVVPRSSSGKLAMDPATVTLVVAGLGTVNALIAALASVWVAKIAAARERSPAATPVTPVAPVLHLHTDLDSIRVLLGADGGVRSTSAALPERLDEITEVVLSTEPG